MFGSHFSDHRVKGGLPTRDLFPDCRTLKDRQKHYLGGVAPVVAVDPELVSLANKLAMLTIRFPLGLYPSAKMSRDLIVEGVGKSEPLSMASEPPG